MPDSRQCLDARASLDEIRSLRSEFESAYSGASSYGNPDGAERAAVLKGEIEGKVAALRETVAIHEAERLFDLRRQYDAQTSLLRRARLVEAATETDGSGVERETLFMTDLEGRRCPLPSYETVALRMAERRELLSTKADQGFTKLLLVPFGMRLGELFEKFRAYLIEYEKTSDVPAGLIGLDTIKLAWDRTPSRDPDVAAALVYDVRSTDSDRGRRSKFGILEDNDGDNNGAAGWQILLLQGGKDGRGIGEIPTSGDGTSAGTVNPRPDVETGKAPIGYLTDHQMAAALEESPYYGESGMYPEDWMMAFMAHLDQTGKILDSLSQSGSVACLTGAYFPGFFGFPFAYVSDGTIYVGWISAHASPQPNRGARFVVSV